jgi:dynein heavy chain
MVHSNEPWRCSFPPKYENSLSNFQKMMILKVLREEKLIFYVKNFVKVELGLQFIESPPFDLKGSFLDSSPTTPLIFVLSPGADPIPYLEALAAEYGMDVGRLRILSLGQGQGKIAKRYIEGG